MRHLTMIGLIPAIIGISACVTTVTDTQRSEYELHAPEIMAYVAKETGKEPAPIPIARFEKGMDHGAAFYVFGEGTVILPAEWEPDTEGLGSLAHEFTHAVQNHNAPEVRTEQLRWDAAMKRGEAAKPEWAESALKTCLQWETEAYAMGYSHMAFTDPEYVDSILMGLFTIHEAAAIHAKGSCSEVQEWHDQLKSP